MQYFTKSGNYTKPEALHKMQVDSELTYAAAAKLGQAIMHELACDGNLDNRAKGER